MSDMITNPENVTESAGRGDAITAGASPRPWSMFIHEEQEGGDGEISICSKGEWIATMNLRRGTAKAEADAALIVEAVNERDSILEKWKESSRNLVAATSDLYAETKRRVAAEAERDRLRDIVRRLAEQLTDAVKLTPYDAIARALLREARAAIGEGKP